MTKTTFLITAIILSIVKSAHAESPKILDCRVELSSTNPTDDMTPKTGYGKKFVAFKVDQTLDPDLGWMHQNLCVTKKDFVRASFQGDLCLVAIGSRFLESAGGAPALYLYISNSRSQTVKSKKLRDLPNLSFSSTYPMPLPTLELLLGSTAHGDRGGISMVSLNCASARK